MSESPETSPSTPAGPGSSGSSSSPGSRPWNFIVAVALVGLVVSYWLQAQQKHQHANIPPASSTAEPSDEPEETTRPAPSTGPRVDGTRVRGVVIHDQNGRVAFRGTVDLRPTLDRIAAGRVLPEFRHDGTVFQNRERRLPKKAGEYYREWVHPTPGLSGPGPQRVVSGKGGERFYTPDHYETFLSLQAGS